MKILEIAFTNINNLKGEQKISFEKSPLDQAGIFAITGVTGSGKSTILDVITLALFNKIPRFQSSMSKKVIEDAGSIITHHTDNCAAAITYEVRGKRYTSEWKIRKNRNGNFNDYEMYIYNATGIPFDLKKKEVPSKNAEIIGLNYDQFVKSIILSQGQFSKFLKADKNERGQLLENLTGTSIYREIGMAIYERYKKVKKETEMEKDRLENISVLDVEKRKELLKTLAEANEVQRSIGKEIDEFLKVKQVKEEILNLQKELTQKQSEDLDLKAREQEFVHNREKLQLQDKLNPLRASMMRYEDNRKNMERFSVSIDEGEKERKQAVVLLAVTINEMKELSKTEVNEENFLSINSSFEKEIIQLNNELSALLEKGRESRSRIESMIRNANLPLNTDTKNGDIAVSEIEALRKKWTESISAAGVALKDFNTVTTIYNQQSEDLTLLQNLQGEFVRIKEFQKNKDLIRGNLLKAEQEISHRTPLLENHGLLVVSLGKQKELLIKQKHDQMVIASLEEQRHALEDGKPCPLCGAEKHPYTVNLPEENSDLDSEIHKAHLNFEKAKDEQKELQSILTTATTEKSQFEKRIIEVQEQMRDTNSKIETLHKQLGDYKVQNEEEVKKEIDLLKNRLAKISEAMNVIHKMEPLNRVEEEYSEIGKVGKQYKKLKDEIDSKYNGGDVSKDCNELQNKFNRSKSKISTIDGVLKTTQKAKEACQITLDSVSEALFPKLNAVGFDNLDIALSALMDEESVSKLNAQKDALVRQRASVDTQLKDLKSRLTKARESDTSLDKELSDISLKLAEKERSRSTILEAYGKAKAEIEQDDKQREKLKSKKEAIDALNLKLSKWKRMNDMIGGATGSTFANFAQGLTLQNLLVYANLRLEKLTDRYLLDRPENEGPLMVVDQYVGNSKRAVTTLSGGESFLISLALALSLSDMASRNVRLESLFIDEGFGTLDQETLDVAMNTLERLQTESQKTVGIISHVEALKERISVQVQLEKDAQGFSSINVVG